MNLACYLKIKVVEKPGKKLIDYMKSFDKTKENPKCNESDCLVFKNDKSTTGGTCRKSDVVYKITCEECRKMKKSAIYYGETNFNAYTRGKQHLEKYNYSNLNTQEKSVLRRHAKDFHNDQEIEYKMNILKSFREDPLSRQIFESQKIVESKEIDDFPLNTKNEFNQALIVTAKNHEGNT